MDEIPVLAGPSCRIGPPDSIESTTKPEHPCGVQDDVWRRRCGCLKTSEKLKKILSTFPEPETPPSTPTPTPRSNYKNTYSFTVGKTPTSSTQKCSRHDFDLELLGAEFKYQQPCCDSKKWASWKTVAELIYLVHLAVTATTLALYYLFYCYMQLVYYTLKSAMYFHNADGLEPMKITIGVVTMTSLLVGFNLILRIERLLGLLY